MSLNTVEILLQDHDTMRTTGRSLLDSEADGSSSDELPAYSTDEVPESTEDESETGKLIMDIPYGHTTMQAETLIRQFPGRGKVSEYNAKLWWKVISSHY